MLGKVWSRIARTVPQRRRTETQAWPSPSFARRRMLSPLSAHQKIKVTVFSLRAPRHQHNDIHNNDAQPNDIQNNDTQLRTLRTIPFSITINKMRHST